MRDSYSDFPNKYCRETGEEGKGKEGDLQSEEDKFQTKSLKHRIEIKHIKNYYLKSHQHFIVENQG